MLVPHLIKKCTKTLWHSEGLYPRLGRADPFQACEPEPLHGRNVSRSCWEGPFEERWRGLCTQHGSRGRNRGCRGDLLLKLLSCVCVNINFVHALLSIKFLPIGLLGQENLRTAEYNVCTTSLGHDYKEAVSFNLRRSKAAECKLFFVVWNLIKS